MTVSEILKTPDFSWGFVKVWKRNFLQFKKTWMVSVFWIILEPLMYLGGIGYGLGSFVNSMDGIPFLEFFFPGLLCSTAAMVAFFETTYANYTKLTYQKIYSSIMMTRIGPEDIVFGEVIWAATKGFFSVCGVSLIASFFGLVGTFRIIPVLIVLFLLSFLFACIGMIVTSLARSYDSFIYATSGFLIPMMFLSGIYFPVEEFPTLVRYFTYLLPLTHGVSSVRMLLVDGFTPVFWVHYGVLLVLSLLLMNIAVFRIRRRLLK